MFCSKCGAQIGEGAAFCSACGAPAAAVGAVAAPPVAPAAAPPVQPPAPVYAAAAPVPPTPPTPAPTVGYAGFWLRLVAAIIDGILISIPLAPFYIGIFASMIPQLTHSDDPFDVLAAVLPRIALLLVLATLASWLYWSLLESSPWQATLGKKALGLYVTDLTGNRVSFGRASGRFCGGRLLGMVPYIGGLYFLVDCICAGVTQRKQALHDMMASCLVLRKL